MRTSPNISLESIRYFYIKQVVNTDMVLIFLLVTPVVFWVRRTISEQELPGRPHHIHEHSIEPHIEPLWPRRLDPGRHRVVHEEYHELNDTGRDALFVAVCHVPKCIAEESLLHSLVAGFIIDGDLERFVDAGIALEPMPSSRRNDNLVTLGQVDGLVPQMPCPSAGNDGEVLILEQVVVRRGMPHRFFRVALVVLGRIGLFVEECAHAFGLEVVKLDIERPCAESASLTGF